MNSLYNILQKGWEKYSLHNILFTIEYTQWFLVALNILVLYGTYTISVWYLGLIPIFIYFISKLNNLGDKLMEDLYQTTHASIAKKLDKILKEDDEKI